MMLSEQQIQSLFTFCEKHFVKYYDVQVELVDHLANAVELEMQKDPKISFEKALEKVHQSFGVMGFAPLVAEKQAAAEKQSRKLFWHLLKGQFGWPKVLAFFVVTAILFSIFTFDNSLMNSFSFVIVFLCWPVLLVSLLRIRRELGKTGKKFLIVNFSWISILLFLPIYSLNISIVFKEFIGESIFIYVPLRILIAGLSIFLSLYLIVIISVWQTLTAVKNNLYQTYPEVFSVA
ncbi:MAG: hypothetical protein ABI267_08845 [Ginsengibacter sp.]